MSDTFTPNFRLTRTAFDTRNWQDKVNNNFSTLDAVVGSFLPLSGLKGVWTNNLPIVANDILVDGDLGSLWKANSSHTTPAIGTFFEDRLANPSRWSVFTQAAKARGEWMAATNYNVNDFVVVTSGPDKKFAIAITTHLSGADFNTDLGAGKWEVLIDATLSGLGLGTMATQDANNVNITGGIITGVDLDSVPLVATDLLDHLIIRDNSAGGIIGRNLVSDVLNFGNYTPTFTATSNIDAITAQGLVNYIVFFNSLVFVFGQCNIDATTTLVDTVGRISLPVPSNFTLDQQLSGIIAGQTNTEGGRIIATIATDDATFTFKPVGTTNQRYAFMFGYVIA